MGMVEALHRHALVAQHVQRGRRERGIGQQRETELRVRGAVLRRLARELLATVLASLPDQPRVFAAAVQGHEQLAAEEQQRRAMRFVRIVIGAGIGQRACELGRALQALCQQEQVRAERGLLVLSPDDAQHQRLQALDAAGLQELRDRQRRRCVAGVRQQLQAEQGIAAEQIRDAATHVGGGLHVTGERQQRRQHRGQATGAVDDLAGQGRVTGHHGSARPRLVPGRYRRRPRCDLDAVHACRSPLRPRGRAPL